MSRVLLITTEPIALPGWPTTGAGLRAWNLAQGLRSKGHAVKILIPRDCLDNFAESSENTHAKSLSGLWEALPEDVGTFARKENIAPAELADCDVIVLQHWGVARHVPETSIPLAIDLAGPHLLERHFWESDYESDLVEKLDALRRADFVTVSGQVQRAYFLSFLQMAGWDIGESKNIAPVIPYSISADDAPAPARADRFILGGYFLPWQDPSAGVEVVLDELDRSERGELVVVGGAHPHFDFSRGKFERLLGRLEAHPRVRQLDPMSHDRYVALLREGGVALDLVARNAERELAFTSRTVQAMACGVPVIYNDYSELSLMIGEREAGWTLDPADSEGLRGLVAGLLGGEIDPTPFGRAANALVGDELDPSKTIEPLDRYCCDAKPRLGKAGARLRYESQTMARRELEATVEAQRAELKTLRGKRWVRWGLRLFTRGGVGAILVSIFAVLAGLMLFPIFWINDRLK